MPPSGRWLTLSVWRLAVVQKVLLVRHRGGLAARADAELAQDVGNVHAGRLGRDDEPGGEVAVAAAAGHQAQSFEFALGEPERRGSAGSTCPRGPGRAGTST